MLRTTVAVLVLLLLASPSGAEEPAAPDYSRVAPVFRKYCAGCHNDADREGDFSLESYASLRKGAGERPALLPGDADASRIVRLMTSQAEPAMPPEGEARPSEAEIALIRAWIDAGAKGPADSGLDPLTLVVPDIEPRNATRPITALALRSDGRWLAEARFRSITLRAPSPSAEQREKRLGKLPGKVTALHFSRDGERLIAASGVAGLGGVAALFDVADGRLVRKFEGHGDILYDAELSPDGKLLATCSYDRTIGLWDVESGKQVRTLGGHNGAVYDVAFDPTGRFLVSASADDTCKVWRVSDGQRLDTLGQPLKEVYCCEFTPDGRFIVAGGADNNIRVWRFISRDKPRINPMVKARFAHEGPIVRLALTPDGSRLVTLGEDRTIKVWDTRDYRELRLWENQPEVAMTLAIAGDGRSFHVGRMDGSLAEFPLPSASDAAEDTVATVAEANVPMDDMPAADEQVEREPNNAPDQATEVAAPARIKGTIQGRAGQEADSDLFRFSARAGEQWVIEVNAARSKSKLDSFIEVLDERGNRIPRVLLQAVRDSYFTFRGKDDVTVDDFRVFNWQEMRLDEYLYANGEVVKLWLYPRGPDSGFMVYPGQGKRWGYFDTTPLAHALGEPCYVVRPHPPGTELIPNGLPIFPLYYENDDDSRRELGKDSKLFFTAPADGTYLVKIKDVRGYEGEGFDYHLSIRPRRPDFQVTLHGGTLAVGPGGAKEFKVTARRLDGFEGPIRVELQGLPAGFTATTPIVIEPGQIEALGVILAGENAEATELPGKVTARVTAQVWDQEVTRAANGTLELKRAESPKVQVEIVGTEGGAPVERDEDSGWLRVAAAPGETITLKVRVNRQDFSGQVPFGKEGAGRNLPFGVYVDNLGLNGLLVLEEQQERTFFVTIDPAVPPQRRLFHLNTSAAGGQASPPILLDIRRPDETARAEGPSQDDSP